MDGYTGYFEIDLFWLIVLANLMMYLATMVISHLWSKYHNYKVYPVSFGDVKLSLMVLAINVLVAIPGLFLLRNGLIKFEMSGYFYRDLLLLFFGFDLLMYVVHRLSHVMWPFNIFHGKHHEHTYFNSISLYVMEPVEAILFGFLLTVSAWMFHFNYYSFILFLGINWLLGVVGHLNSTSTKQPKYFGNHVFHKIHHKNGHTNFGFYTVIWDRIFKTYYLDKKNN